VTSPTGRRPRVVVVGSLNLDLVLRGDRLPRAGETVHARDLLRVPGGKGANQAVAAARLGAEVAMIGRVGDDEFARPLLGSLAREGIDASAVLVAPGCTTGVAVIGVDAAGRNAITVVPGANGTLRPEDLERHESLIRSADALLVQFEVPPETTAAAIALARRHDVLSILDPAPVPPAMPDGAWEADILSPNQAEAEQLTGIAVTDEASAAAAAHALRVRGAGRVVLKLGELGAYLAVGDGPASLVPSWPVTAVDTTAAGDAFTTALAVAWVEGRPPREAVRFATAAGALATTRVGAQPAMPTRGEVDVLMESSQES
jgi:ribokinase